MTEPPKGGWWTFVRNRLKAGLQYVRWVGGDDGWLRWERGGRKEAQKRILFVRNRL